MSTAKTFVLRIAGIGIAAGFLGLGVLGLVLIGTAATGPLSLPERIVLLLLGGFGLIIAIGFVMTKMNQPSTVR